MADAKARTIKLCPSCRKQNLPEIRLPDGIVLTIDNFEDTCAVCVDADGSMYFISLKLIPENTREGDVIRHISNGTFEKTE